MLFESTRPVRPLVWLRCIAAAAVLACALVGNAQAGYAALVLDASTGQVLNAVNPDEPNHPASLTKMMTLYLAFQALNSGRLTLDQQLPVSAHAADKAPTKLGLRAGQTISVRDCILGMITKSANDAATVIAEKLGGTEDHFVTMMNAQGLLLGMTRTRFGSASGLPDPDDATTARDVGKLAMALYRDFPHQAPYFATREFTFRGQVVRGHNHLMDRYPGMDGLKTGFTNASGFNLASTAVRDGHRLFGVVLGGRTSTARDDLMARLLDDGFEHRQTPSTLVARAGMPERRGMARRLLASLSPIGTADAEPAPATRMAKGARKTASSSRHVHGRAKRSAVRLACQPRGRSRTHCRERTTRSGHAVKLARKHAGKKLQLASR